uniref:ADP-ribosylation factor-like protein 2-binding protein n=1 Tax=Glossina brevipalpis TaxID=37001 RepID=A0A1A9WAH5_9MUSC
MDYVDDDGQFDIVCHSAGSQFFDQVIGHIEDIVLSEEFQSSHETFLDKYCMKFENKEENQLEYMDIFQQYATTFEKFLVKEVTKHMNNFDMKRFAKELQTYETKGQDPFKDSEIYELLHSFHDFQTFKELMLDYRSRKEGNMQHMNFDILITKPLLDDGSDGSSDNFAIE